MAEGLFGLGLSATLVLLYGSSNVLAMIIVTIKSAWEEIQARSQRQKQGQEVYSGPDLESGKSRYDIGVQYLPRGTITLPSGEAPPSVRSTKSDKNSEKAFSFKDKPTSPKSSNNKNKHKNDNSNNNKNNTNYTFLDSISPREHHMSILSMSSDVSTANPDSENQTRRMPTHIKQTKVGLQFGKKEKKDPILDDLNRSFLNKWFWRTWRYRAVVLPFMIHVWDTATDLGVLIQWYVEADYSEKNLLKSIIDDRKEITILGLALFSTCAMLVYRLISALTIYKVSNRDVKETLLQVLDMKILRDLANLGTDQDTIDTLRWVHKMEALLESGPQALLQIVFVMKEEKLEGELESGDYIIFLSLFFSLCTLATRLINDDRYVFVQSANSMFPPSIGFIMRAFFRLFEVTARIFSVAFIWVMFGSGVVFGWWLFQALLLFLLYRAGYLGLEVWNVFGYILATPDLALKELPESATATRLERLLLYLLGVIGCWWLGGCMYIMDKVKNKWNIGYLFIVSRSLENSIILFTVLIVSSFEGALCFHCVAFDERNNLLFGSSLGFFIIGIFSIIIESLLYYKIRELELISENLMLVRSGNPLELLEAKRYDQFKKFLAGDGKNIDTGTGKTKISDEIDENIIISSAMYSSQIGDVKALEILGLIDYISMYYAFIFCFLLLLLYCYCGRLFCFCCICILSSYNHFCFLCFLFVVNGPGSMAFNFDTTDQFGYTCLIYAARHDHAECITILHKYGANLECVDKHFKSAAIHAAEIGNPNCLRALGQLNANLEATDDGGSSVSHYAFENGHMDCITVLTQFGVEYTDIFLPLLFLFFFILLVFLGTLLLCVFYCVYFVFSFFFFSAKG